MDGKDAVDAERPELKIKLLHGCQNAWKTTWLTERTLAIIRSPPGSYAERLSSMEAGPADRRLVIRRSFKQSVRLTFLCADRGKRHPL